MSESDKHTLRGAVSAGVDLSVALWDIYFPSSPLTGGREWKYGRRHYPLTRDDLFGVENALPKDSHARGIAQELMLSILRHPSNVDTKDLRLPSDYLSSPLSLPEDLIAAGVLRPISPEESAVYSSCSSDIKYFCLRRLRQRFLAERSPRLARTFRSFSLVLNGMRSATARDETSLRTSRTISRSHRHGSITVGLNEIRSSLLVDGEADQTLLGWRDLFLAICRLVGYLQPGYRPGEVRLNTREVDAEYLLSHLFGMPTEIPGLDDLFGGGGISLNDTLPGIVNDNHGRTILIKGRFGTGKTLLALQLSCEVARKGGTASYLALEQSPRDCLYSLEALGLLHPVNPIAVSTDPIDAAIGLKRGDTGVGHLAITGGPSASIESFLGSMRDEARFITGGFKCVALDPVNAVYREADLGASSLRTRFAEALMDVKRLGVNVILVSEDSHQDSHTAWFEENIVDTVIHLSERNEHGYSRRVLEIQKSRLQREHRGRHVYSIQPMTGFSVFPSSAAVETKIRRREIPGPSRSTETPFGLPELDGLLGSALHRGDIIAIKGKTGTHKSSLAMAFLQTCDRVGAVEGLVSRRALLITPRDPESTIEYQIGHGWIQQLRSQLENSNAKVMLRHPGDVVVLPLPLGHIHPGAILREIESAFDDAKRNSLSIDRVVVDNVAHWEMSCPFVREDDVFPDVLVDLFRSRRATTLFVCGEVGSDSTIQKPIIDSADCLLELERFSYRGRARVSLRVLKTRDSTHAREPYEVYKDSLGLSISPLLLRESSVGNYESLPIRLFLHSESDAQTSYNSHWRDRLKTSLSRDVDVESQSRVNTFASLSLRQSACVDELHVYQLDEFELQVNSTLKQRHEGDTSSSVAPSTQTREDDVLDRMLPQYRNRCKDASGYFAVPFYADIGFLAFRKQALAEVCAQFAEDPASVVKDWRALGRLSEKYSRECISESKSVESLFFDFPHVTPENYNCLFLEILISLVGSRDVADPLSIFNGGVSIDAMEIFWQLGRPGYIRDRRQRHPRIMRLAGDLDDGEIPPARQDDVSEPFRVSKDCIVWRHWFSTLNQMMSEADRPSFEGDIEVQTLPGSLSVAGEWYLAVPEQSAAKPLARQIVLDAVSSRQEIDRLRRGVGLPVQTSFYMERPDNDKVALGPFFELRLDMLKKEMGTLVRRSQFKGYAIWNRSLSYHLQRILRVTSTDTESRRLSLSEISNDLVASIKFLLSQSE